MNCEEFEVLLADFLDGTLGAPERAALEGHMAGCMGCRQFMLDAAAGRDLAVRAEGLATPPELVTRIAYLAPVGRTRRPFEQPGLFSKLKALWIQPLLQPRIAMGMAMTILSFAMLQRCTGIQVQRVEAADLSPLKIWGDFENRSVRLKDRAVKYYENIRFVYDIEVRLREMENQQAVAQDEARRRQRSNAGAKPSTQAAPGQRTPGEKKK
jgi:hypothetical protein